MFISSDFWKTGDTLILNLEKENMDLGYNPARDGTEVTFVDFGEISHGHINHYGRGPGVHQNRCWADVKLPSGKVKCINTCHLSFKNLTEDLLSQRKNEFGDKPWKTRSTLLRPLPKTKFWEWDIVEYDENKAGIISRINFDYIHKTRSDGSPWPIYDVSPDMNFGSWTARCKSEIKLLQRGMVWKWYHKEPVSFISLEEEVRLHYALSLYDEVRNPRTELYSWTKEEILLAIKNQIIDGLSVGSTLCATSISHRGIKFHDRSLGKRVREATLRGFGLT